LRTLLVCGALVAALLLSRESSEAADGFKASATVSRAVPADVLTLSFHLIERSMPEEQSRLRTEELRIREEIQKAGASIVSWTSRIEVVNAGFSTTTFNYINPDSRERQAVDIRREIVARLSGLTDAEPIAAVLGRNAIRHRVMLAWSASQADAVRDELALEATGAAVKKARALAERAGSKAGGVVDLVIQPASLVTVPFEMTSPSGGSTFTYRPNFPPDEMIEDEKGRRIVIHVTALVTLQAKPD
jgi:hypothetical protein